MLALVAQVVESRIVEVRLASTPDEGTIFLE
jgi:hypothetical protein